MKNYLFWIILLISNTIFSQEKEVETPFAVADSLYREDQFYFGITYNSLINAPQDLAQNGLSVGLNAGFLRDFPINKSRTVAIAVGFGATYNKFHQNLLVSKQNNVIAYELTTNQVYNKNKLEQLMIDIPIEFRWRTSTPEKHQFFRIYTGFKFGYLVFNKTKFVGDNNTENILNSKDFNKLQYGPTISVGYNTWNLYAYYGLRPIFRNALLDAQLIKMSNLNLGLIFYIL